MVWWHPEDFKRKIPYLHARAEVLRAVRGFFDARGYLEVETPALQVSPCMEPHIQAFKTELVSADRQTRQTMYLHTSPEFAMKKLLVAGLPKIYQFAKVFRNAEGSSWHSPEFAMLEWYQAGMDYKDMMQETIDLLRHVAVEPMTALGKTSDLHLPWEKITVVEALKKYAGVDISEHLNDLGHIVKEAARIGVHVSPHDDWDNALLKILMDRVEPQLGTPAPAIIYDYPVSMAALSRPKPEDPRFAERFEVYVCGIELANAFGELTDAKSQRERFLHDVAARKRLYGDDYPVDEDFLKALEYGLPNSSGNALGLDRLVMLVTGADRIALVQAAPVIGDGEVEG
jgi:lysyl-tRNA synthetase class 2